MKCPFCGCLDTAVLDSREGPDSTFTRRRRSCENCRGRFTTYERIEGIEIKVVKKDGSLENFDREKIKRGVVKATWKRPVSMESIEKLLDEVEQSLRLKGQKEIKSWEVGNLIIERLRALDKLSYLLFASVYRDFSSLEDFENELKELREAKGVEAERVAGREAAMGALG
jgi:transcriptional repressor NrdR